MKGKFRLFISILVLIGVLIPVFTVKAEANETAENGIMKITHFSKNEIVKVNGKWQFYWHQLYTPTDFKLKNVQTKPLMKIVPQNWTSYKLAGKNLPLTGYATYRLQIQLPETEIGTAKALLMPSVASAYKLWINGEEKSKNGRVGTSREGMKPNITPMVIPFLVDSNSIELIIQVSNFHQRSAGLNEEILIGEPETILKYREKSLIYRAVIVVSLVIIGLYHIVLFVFRKQEYSFLFFAIVCILVAIRATLLEEGLASYLLSFLNWEVARKLEYLGASLGTLFFTLFAYTQFPDDMNRRLRNFVTMVLSCYSLFVVLTPAVIFTRTMVLLQVLIILAFLIILSVYFTAARRRREGSFLNTVAIFLVFLTVINDTLFYNDLIQTSELTSVGLFFFLFTQAIILSKNYAKSFARAEQLSLDLGLLNESLEQQVQERTMELEQANQELFVTNQRLNEAQASKNKWIRNISHEIAAPLTNIRSYTKGIIDGVIQPDKQYIQLIYNQSLYFSQMLDDLHDIADIENNQIKFTMKKVNIREYARSLYDKYRWDIEKQGIVFVFKDLLSEYADEPYVLMDPVRIEQVIVNLLTNAQRFVSDNGKITLEQVGEGENEVTIKLRDNGTGIKEAELDFVFNRFYKNNHKGRPHNGAGLGLAISKEIIEYHKGKISVESKPGEGSCFYFTLPLIR